MSKKPKGDKFAAMTVDEIFAAWEKAARDSLAAGLTYDDRIFAPRGRLVSTYKRAIARRKADTTHPPFNAADFRNSTRVARDIARICSLLCADRTDHKVPFDVFEQAAGLAKVHAACPVAPSIGTGRWCDVGV